MTRSLRTTFPLPQPLSYKANPKLSTNMKSGGNVACSQETKFRMIQLADEVFEKVKKEMH